MEDGSAHLLARDQRFVEDVEVVAAGRDDKLELVQRLDLVADLRLVERLERRADMMGQSGMREVAETSRRVGRDEDRDLGDVCLGEVQADSAL